MKEKYFLATANLLLMAIFALFVYHRYSYVAQFYEAYDFKYSILDIIKAIKHDLFILMLSVLSMIGILLGSNNKFFFYISAFYAAAQIVLLCKTVSLSFAYAFTAIVFTIFLWFLIMSDAFSVFENKRSLKLISLLIGVVLYILIFLFW